MCHHVERGKCAECRASAGKSGERLPRSPDKSGLRAGRLSRTARTEYMPYLCSRTREIVDHREKPRFIVFKSCFASCYFPKESCIIVLYRVKNKESFFSTTPYQLKRQFKALSAWGLAKFKLNIGRLSGVLLTIQSTK